MGSEEAADIGMEVVVSVGRTKCSEVPNVYCLI